MGSSPSIEEQAKKDAAFQKYIDEQNAVLAKTTNEAKADMAQQIQEFYKAGGWTDAKPLASGAYQHLSTASEWSLKHVTDMIDGVRDAIMGEAPLPAAPTSDVPKPKDATGTDVPELDAKTKSLMQMAGGTEMIIANAAFQAISSILAAFSSSTETSLVKNVKQKEIIPGLSLFVCVMENKYHRSDFFSDEIIVQNFYIFDARMSVSRGADIAKFDRLSGLIAQQGDLETQASDLSGSIGALSLADYKTKHKDDLSAALKDYKSDFSMLEEMLQEINKSIEDTGKQIDSLKEAKAAANALLVRAKRRELMLLS